MGLAILPPRLKDELKEVANYLLGQPNRIAAYHLKWAQDIKRTQHEISSTNVNSVLQKEVGKVFARVLEDAGVFKRDQQGHVAFLKFAKEVGLK